MTCTDSGSHDRPATCMFTGIVGTCSLEAWCALLSRLSEKGDHNLGPDGGCGVCSLGDGVYYQHIPHRDGIAATMIWTVV